MSRRLISVVCAEERVIETLLKSFETSSKDDCVALTVAETIFKSPDMLDELAIPLSNFDLTSLASAEKSLLNC